MVSNVEMGKRLENLRNDANLTQAQLADYLGINQSMLSKIESGERSIGMSYLEKLSSLYCISSYDLANKDNIDSQMQIAFRAKKLTSDDLFILAKVNRIIMNQRFMDGLKEDQISNAIK